MGCGTGNREYEDLFLRHGVVTIGPGEVDADDPDPPETEPRRLKQEVQEGDLVVAKKRPGSGHQDFRVAGIGEVHGGYESLEAFRDVYGWDIPHARRVRWCRPPEGDTVRVSQLKRGRFYQVWEATEEIKELYESWPEADNPEDVPAVESHSWSELLPEKAKKAREVEGLARRLRRFYTVGKSPGTRSGNEHEVRTHLVVPFLKLLGWRVDQLRIEYNNADIVGMTPSFMDDNASVALIVETKHFEHDLEAAAPQVQDYKDSLGVDQAVTVETDGARYIVREESDTVSHLHLLYRWKEQPWEPGQGGAAQAIAALRPDGP